MLIRQKMQETGKEIEESFFQRGTLFFTNKQKNDTSSNNIKLKVLDNGTTLTFKVYGITHIICSFLIFFVRLIERAPP